MNVAINFDIEFEDTTITNVRVTDGGWCVDLDDGLSLFIPNKQCKTTPQCGEIISLYGKGLGYIVRGIVINDRAYRYKSNAEQELENIEERRRIKEDIDRETENFVNSLPTLPPLPSFCITDQDGWNDCVKVNSKDPYGYEIIRYAAAWANLMESRMANGEKLADIANDTSHEADTDGITGFMYGAAVSTLSHFWVHGEALRRWHNKDLSPTQGDVANEAGVVLNPALLTISV